MIIAPDRRHSFLFLPLLQLTQLDLRKIPKCLRRHASADSPRRGDSASRSSTAPPFFSTEQKPGARLPPLRCSRCRPIIRYGSAIANDASPATAVALPEGSCPSGSVLFRGPSIRTRLPGRIARSVGLVAPVLSFQRQRVARLASYVRFINSPIERLVIRARASTILDWIVGSCLVN
jgi:hypothetical protein